MARPRWRAVRGRPSWPGARCRRMGRQGVGAAAGPRGGQRGVGRRLDADTGRHRPCRRARCRAVTDGLDVLASPAASSARPRCPDGCTRRADHARVPRRCARRGPPRAGRSACWPTASAWLSAAARCSTCRRVSGRSPTTPSRTSPSSGPGDGRVRRGVPRRVRLLTVRMYESAGEAWGGWGRSLSLPGWISAASARPAGRRRARPGAAAGPAGGAARRRARRRPPRGTPRHARGDGGRPTDHAGWRTGSRRRLMSSPLPPGRGRPAATTGAASPARHSRPPDESRRRHARSGSR